MNRKESRERHEPRKAFQDYVRKDPRFGHAEAAFLKDVFGRVARRAVSRLTQETVQNVTTPAVVPNTDTSRSLIVLNPQPQSWQDVIPADITGYRRERLLQFGRGLEHQYAVKEAIDASNRYYTFSPYGVRTSIGFSRKDAFHMGAVRESVIETELMGDLHLAPIAEGIMRAIRALHNDLTTLSTDELDTMWEVK